MLITKYRQELANTECKKLRDTNYKYCPYGDNCKYIYFFIIYVYIYIYIKFLFLFFFFFFFFFLFIFFFFF